MSELKTRFADDETLQLLHELSSENELYRKRLEGVSDRAGLLAVLKGLEAENKRLKDLVQLLKMALPIEMGGTPDLFYPQFFLGHKDDDPWGDWEAALIENYSDILYPEEQGDE